MAFVLDASSVQNLKPGKVLRLTRVEGDVDAASLTSYTAHQIGQTIVFPRQFERYFAGLELERITDSDGQVLSNKIGEGAIELMGMGGDLTAKYMAFRKR